MPARLLVLLIALATRPVDASAAGAHWVPVDCDDRPGEVAAVWPGGTASLERVWEAQERAVREARPGDRDYVPRPFPQGRREVVEDFLYGYFHRFHASPRSVESEERETYRDLRHGRARFEVERVETWSPSRCSRIARWPFHYLVRVYDARGREASRGSVAPSGEIGMYGRLTDRIRPLPLPRELNRVLGERYGLEMGVQRAQLVTLGGLPSQCSVLQPCIAFRANGHTYVMETGPFSNSLYEIPADSRRVAVRDFAAERAASGLGLCQVDFERPLVSIGFEWAEARRVAIARGEDGRGGRIDGAAPP